MQTIHGTLYYRTPAGEVIDLGDLGGGVTVSTKAGELPIDAGQSGDEFINITDQRQFIFTGLSWVERPYPPMRHRQHPRLDGHGGRWLQDEVRDG